MRIKKNKTTVSFFYKKGIDYGKNLLDELSQWMDFHGFASINDFKAQMNFSKIDNPSIYFRTQFIKYLIENE